MVHAQTIDLHQNDNRTISNENRQIAVQTDDALFG